MNQKTWDTTRTVAAIVGFVSVIAMYKLLVMLEDD